jgi:hypothetical protein
MRPLASACAIGLTLLVTACGGGETGDDDDDDDDDSVTVDGGEGVDAPAGEDLDMQASDFDCILDGTRVRQFFIKNPLGHLDEALAVADAANGGAYPVGTIIQLIPQEAMVKRAAGWNPTTNDWEFFALSVSGGTTEISARGVEDVENSFGGNCFQCHAQAEPQWDLVCEDTHGCEPLSISDQIIESLQNGDSRCD